MRGHDYAFSYILRLSNMLLFRCLTEATGAGRRE